MLARPAAWEVLAAGLARRRPVRADYHGTTRVLCPHILGWKNRRPMVFSYQCDGDTSSGPLPSDERQRWRLMYVDEIVDATLVESPWRSADNYQPGRTGIDIVELTCDSGHLK